MRVAFLSDIHANLPALRAALHAAEQHGAARVVVAGDVVGEGPHPAEVIQLLRERDVPTIRGNVDARVAALLGQSPKKLLKRLRDKPRKRPSDAWTALQLGPEEQQWLSHLPPEQELEVAGSRVRVVHGSPLGDTDYIYPSLTVPALRAKLGEDRPAVLVCGHSHVPFTAQVGGVRVVNCGSVGRPADGDPRGSFALVDFADPAALASAIVRFAYPVDQVVAALLERAVPGVEPEEWRRGVKS